MQMSLDSPRVSPLVNAHWARKPLRARIYPSPIFRCANLREARLHNSVLESSFNAWPCGFSFLSTRAPSIFICDLRVPICPTEFLGGRSFPMRN